METDRDYNSLLWSDEYARALLLGLVVCMGTLNLRMQAMRTRGFSIASDLSRMFYI